MTGNKLLSRIILSLNTYLGFNDQSLTDLIDIDDNLEDAIVWLGTLNPPPPLIAFIHSLEKIRQADQNNFLNTPYTNIGSVATIDFNQAKFVNKNRRIAFRDTEFSFVSSQAFFDSGSLIDLSAPDNWMIWQQVEEFLERCYSVINTAMIHLFFDTIQTANLNIGFVVNKTGQAFNEDQHYPYIYLSFLNESNSILLPSSLKYSPSNLHPAFTYDATRDYEQYFDIYDVLNELNQAPDILNRFLRLFHTFEYLVYRVYLVDLVTRVGSSRLFVREFISSAENMKKGEKETFKKNFVKIFAADLVPTITPALSPHDLPGVIDFLSKKNITKAYTSTDINKVADLVYQIRCCIVHNKESEYHMTISNSEEYAVIIPLIKQLLVVFEKLVVAKITANQAEITYTQKSVTLF